MHVIAAKAVAFGEALRPEFRDYSARIIANARALGEGLLERGFTLVSGGTDNHLLLVDLRSKGITVNTNTVPGETESPFATSGIRIGTPALTTRGLGIGEMREIAGFIDEAIQARDDEAVLEGIRGRVREMCDRFPLYGEWTRA